MSQPPSGSNPQDQNPSGSSSSQGQPGQQPGQPYGGEQGPQFSQPQGDQPGHQQQGYQGYQQQGSPQDPGQGYQQQGGYQQFAGGEQGKPPKKKFGFRAIVTLVIIVVGLGIGGWQLLSNWQRDQALQVGNCVTVEGESDDTKISSADCDEDASEGVVYEVLEVHDGSYTCADPLVTYTEERSRRGISTGTSKTVCMGEVLQADQCYESFEGLAGIRSVDCPGGEFKVTKVEDSADATCEGSDQPLAYETWPKLYCLGQPA